MYWAKPNDSASSRTVRRNRCWPRSRSASRRSTPTTTASWTGWSQKDLACTTGTFTADLRHALQTQILRLAPKLKATQTAQINRAGIASVSPSGDQVVTLIYGQLPSRTTETAKSSPRVDVVGAVVTVDNVHGTWLISKVDSDTGS